MRGMSKSKVRDQETEGHEQDLVSSRTSSIVFRASCFALDKECFMSE